jgi:hypothetical protein
MTLASFVVVEILGQKNGIVRWALARMEQKLAENWYGDNSEHVTAETDTEMEGSWFA